MAGYEPKPKTYRLRFEDHEGLEVEATSLTIGEFLNVSKLADAVGGGGTDESVTDLLATFARHLVKWNVTSRGKPVPATFDGVKTQHLDFILEIILAWMGAIASVDTPLPPQLNGGGTSLEASLPMDALSPSLAS